MKNNLFAFIFLGVSVLSICKAQTGHRILRKPAETFRKATPLSGRKLAGFHNGPIRIVFNTRFAEQQLSKAAWARPKISFAMKILEDTKRYLEKTLTVSRPFFSSFNSFYCGGVAVEGVQGPFDLMIMIQLTTKESSAFASAGSCLPNSFNGASLVGTVYLNPNKLEISNENRHMYFFSFLHEIIHVLGSNEFLFKQFRQRDGSGRMTNQKMRLNDVIGQQNFNNRIYSILKTPGLVRLARKYFNCNRLEGIPLENGGGAGSAGSHFDKRFFGDEAMNPSQDLPAVISVFTLQLLHDSGWYDVNFQMAQNYSDAQGAGCGFFFGDDISNARGFCKVGAPNACSADYKGEASCSTREFLEGRGYRSIVQYRYCPSKSPQQDPIFLGSIEHQGPLSRCWNSKHGSLSYPLCLQSDCFGGKPTYYINGKRYICQKEGDKLSVSFTKYEIEISSEIICPDPQDFCREWNKGCTFDCGGNRGVCLQNKTCFFYFSMPEEK
jgi:hypothetical protein